MNIKLETEQDRQREEIVVKRLTQKKEVESIKLPEYSIADYLIIVNNKINTFAELKIRKESENTIRNYGGLMLKYTKYLKLKQLSDLTKVRVWIFFAFDNGVGPIYWLDINKIKNVIPELPPKRKNFRNLSTDDEYVFYLDWRNDLTLWPELL